MIGAAIGVLSMLGFSWIHLYDPLSFPRTSPELVMRLFGDPNWNFGKILAEAMPGAYLFLAGTILACATYLGGFIQALGFTTIFMARGPSNLGVYANAHFDIGFYIALASVSVVMASWGARLSAGQVNAYHSRLAALSPRLAMWAR